MSKKGGAKRISGHVKGIQKIGLCISRIPIQENLFNVNLENWKRDMLLHSLQVPDANLKFGKEKGASRGIIQKCAPHERGPCGRDHMRKP